MKERKILIETKRLSLEEIEQAAKYIRVGEVVAFQTETVYGLGADARNDEAVQKIYRAKGRPSDNPLIVHLASSEDVVRYAQEVPEKAKILMDAFWPGPLTIIFKEKPGILAETVTAGLGTVGLRVPKTEAARKLIQLSNSPIAAPSANTSGRPSPTSADHVLHDLSGKIKAVLDTGTTEVGLESTVLDLSDPEHPVLYRPGGISREAIEEKIGRVEIPQDGLFENKTPKSPGLKYRHYSPEEPVYIVTDNGLGFEKAISHFQDQKERVGLLANLSVVEKYASTVEAVFSLGEPGNVKEASKRLFDGLRFFQDTDTTIILAEAHVKEGLGEAYMNRLEKAAGGRTI